MDAIQARSSYLFPLIAKSWLQLRPVGHQQQKSPLWCNMFALNGGKTNQIQTTTARKKWHCPFSFSFFHSSVCLHSKWSRQGSRDSSFYFFALGRVSLAVLRCFSSCSDPLEVKPNEGTKADRCGRIDSQIPAPALEDTALHTGAIDGQG